MRRNQRYSRTSWLLVPVFALLGVGFLAGNATAQNAEEEDSTSIAIARQTGNNTANVTQNTEVGSGDAVANSQITGVVGDGSVQNDNISLGNASATSGDVNATVNSTVNVGPSAVAGGGGDANPSNATLNAAVNVGPSASAPDGGVAIASQRGNNTANVTQNTVLKSGDCVVNSQVTGVVGDADVQNTNLALGDGTCVSGNVGPPPPDPEADLAVEKEFTAGESHGDCSPTDGPCSLVTFTSTVTNDGPDTAQNVVFTDPAPDGWVLDSFDDSGAPGWDCNQIGEDLVCTKDEMEPGETATFVVTFREDAATNQELATQVINESSVESDTFDPNLDNNTDSACAAREGPNWAECVENDAVLLE